MNVEHSWAQRWTCAVLGDGLRALQGLEGHEDEKTKPILKEKDDIKRSYSFDIRKLFDATLWTYCKQCDSGICWWEKYEWPESLGKFLHSSLGLKVLKWSCFNHSVLSVDHHPKRCSIAGVPQEIIHKNKHEQSILLNAGTILLLVEQINLFGAKVVTVTS